MWIFSNYSVKGYFSYLCGFEWLIRFKVILSAGYGIVNCKVVDISADKASGHEKAYHDRFREVELDVLPRDGGNIEGSAPGWFGIPSVHKVRRRVKLALARAFDVF